MLKIRLRRLGTKKRPFYRIVAIDEKKSRDGRFVEILGWYNPIGKPAKVSLDEDAIIRRLKQGAELSDTVASIFKQVGLSKKYELMNKGEDVSEIKLSETIAERQKRKKKKTAKAE